MDEKITKTSDTPDFFERPGKIFQAFQKVMQEIEAVGKDQRNQQQGYNFRGIDGIYNAVHPIFAKHGVFTIPRVTAREVKERTTKSGGLQFHVVQEFIFRFYAAEDGSFFELGPIWAEGTDTGDKASNKANAAAHKYALLMSLCIPTDDIDDADRTTPDESVAKKPASNQQKPAQNQNNAKGATQQANKPTGSPPNRAPGAQQQAPVRDPSLCTHQQLARVFTAFRNAKWSKEEMTKFLADCFGAEDSNALRAEYFDHVMNGLTMPFDEAMYNYGPEPVDQAPADE